MGSHLGTFLFPFFPLRSFCFRLGMSWEHLSPLCCVTGEWAVTAPGKKVYWAALASLSPQKRDELLRTSKNSVYLKE